MDEYFHSDHFSGIYGALSSEDAKRNELAGRLRDVSGCCNLAGLVARGVAYHHAGLKLFERRLVEFGFSQKIVLVLCTTSTLAMGVNLPVTSIIFRGFDWTIPGNEAKFHQMAGRAGRKGDEGEIIIVPPKIPDSMDKFSALIKTSVVHCWSILNSWRLSRLILEMFILEPRWQVYQLLNFLRKYTLSGIQRKTEFDDEVLNSIKILKELLLLWKYDESDAVSRTFMDATINVYLNRISFLDGSSRDPEKMKLYLTRAAPEPKILVVFDTKVGESITLSPLGRAIIESGLRLPEALESYALILPTLYGGLHFRSKIHLYYLATPTSVFASKSNLNGLKCHLDILNRLTNSWLPKTVKHFLSDTVKIDPVLTRKVIIVFIQPAVSDGVHGSIVIRGKSI